MTFQLKDQKSAGELRPAWTAKPETITATW